MHGGMVAARRNITSIKQELKLPTHAAYVSHNMRQEHL
jgi:hypothetical protein